MRKLIALILVIASLSCFAFADEIDLSNMDLESLIDLHNQIDEIVHEKVNCELDANAIHQGCYVVGKDIRSGRCILTVIESNFECAIYSSFEDMNNYDSGPLYEERVYFEGQSVELTLDEGVILSIEKGVASVQFVDKPDWAP